VSLSGEGIFSAKDVEIAESDVGLIGGGVEGEGIEGERFCGEIGEGEGEIGGEAIDERGGFGEEALGDDGVEICGGEGVRACGEGWGIEGEIEIGEAAVVAESGGAEDGAGRGIWEERGKRGEIGEVKFEGAVEIGEEEGAGMGREGEVSLESGEILATSGLEMEEFGATIFEESEERDFVDGEVGEFGGEEVKGNLTVPGLGIFWATGAEDGDLGEGAELDGQGWAVEVSEGLIEVEMIGEEFEIDDGFGWKEGVQNGSGWGENGELSGAIEGGDVEGGGGFFLGALGGIEVELIDEEMGGELEVMEEKIAIGVGGFGGEMRPDGDGGDAEFFDLERAWEEGIEGEIEVMDFGAVRACANDQREVVDEEAIGEEAWEGDDEIGDAGDGREFEGIGVGIVWGGEVDEGLGDFDRGADFGEVFFEEAWERVVELEVFDGDAVDGGGSGGGGWGDEEVIDGEGGPEISGEMERGLEVEMGGDAGGEEGERVVKDGAVEEGEKEEGEEGSASEAVETTARRTNEGARLGLRHED